MRFYEFGSVENVMELFGTIDSFGYNLDII